MENAAYIHPEDHPKRDGWPQSLAFSRMASFTGTAVRTTGLSMIWVDWDDG